MNDTLNTDISQGHQHQLLIINQENKKTLSANQAAFNKLAARIERLRKEIDKKQLLFDAAIKLYAEKFYPGQREFVLQKRNMLDILWLHYRSKRLSANDQRNLKAFLKEQLHEYLSLNGAVPDDAFKAMFTEIEGERFEIFEKKEKEFQKMMMQDMFDDLDVDIDLGGVDVNDEDALEKKVQEAREKLQERDEKIKANREKRKQKKTKTKAGTLKEAVTQNTNELKHKNIATIYKQLAKLFHPDLEQDEHKKAEKEILMKELTLAYEKKDLHALLSLELKWINKEHDYLEKLSDEKLAVYLQILKEQADMLEREKNEIAMRPQYSVLLEEFGMGVQHQPLREVEESYQQLKSEIDSLALLNDAMNTELGLRHVKSLVKSWKHMQRQQNEYEDDFFELPF